jgi:carotenoid cleavage dioxygenase-like enzyme
VTWFEVEQAALLHVTNAYVDLARDPIATVELPRRVPAGIHGHWIEDNK